MYASLMTRYTQSMCQAMGSVCDSRACQIINTQTQRAVHASDDEDLTWIAAIHLLSTLRFRTSNFLMLALHHAIDASYTSSGWVPGEWTTCVTSRCGSLGRIFTSRTSISSWDGKCSASYDSETGFDAGLLLCTIVLFSFIDVVMMLTSSGDMDEFPKRRPDGSPGTRENNVKETTVQCHWLLMPWSRKWTKLGCPNRK